MGQLALDKSTYDLYKPVGGGVTRTVEGRFIVQQVQSKLRTLLGEWILDTRIGWLSKTDFDRNFSKYDIETKARIIILETDGVKSITTLTSSYSNRVMEISFSAKTIYGVIDLTIPWDNKTT